MDLQPDWSDTLLHDVRNVSGAAAIVFALLPKVVKAYLTKWFKKKTQ